MTPVADAVGGTWRFGAAAAARAGPLGSGGVTENDDRIFGPVIRILRISGRPQVVGAEFGS